MWFSSCVLASRGFGGGAVTTGIGGGGAAQAASPARAAQAARTRRLFDICEFPICAGAGHAASDVGRIAETRDSINSVQPIDVWSTPATRRAQSHRPPRSLSSGVALDLNRVEIGAMRLGCERKRGLQRFEIGCAVRLPTARAGIVPFMRRRDLEIQQADRRSRETERRHVREAGDCMTPQKAIRSDLFIWSSAAIVS
jgi:hypothetical protein